MTRLTLAAAFAALLSTTALADVIHMKSTMSTANEVPPKTTGGTGTVDATVDTATKMLTYTVTYAGLTGPATAAHFHGPAAPGANAGVAVPITVTPSPLKGTATLTDAQMADLTSGKMYVNVHTAANPAGEIRGQVTK